MLLSTLASIVFGSCAASVVSLLCLVNNHVINEKKVNDKYLGM